MRIKRFNNLWTMGLMLCGIALLGVYITKLFFPSFIVGVAEIPNIVKFGNFVDTHLWAYYLVNGIISYGLSYLICCAIVHKRSLSIKQNIVCLIAVIFLFIIQKVFPLVFVEFNYATMIITPTICLLLDNKTNIKHLYSLAIVLSCHWIAQGLTLCIRDISTLISYPNTATFMILMIDMYIWLFLFYFYYNYKEE